MTRQDCGPDSGRLHRWLRGRDAGIWVMVLALPLLVSEPVAQATETRPEWPSWLGIAVISVAFLGAGVVGARRFEAAVGGAPAPALPGYALLAVQAAVTVALVARSPDLALLFPMLAIASVVALDARPGLYSIQVVTAAAAVVVAAADGSSDRIASTILITVLSGLGCWSFRRLFAVIGELARTREELARVAVARERERFSRDLHDLLGHTLSVIVVKAQAVRRLAPLDAEAAAAHGADIEAIGRRALTEVRQAVAGYRGTGFAAELDRARAALSDAGISVRLAGPEQAPALPPEVDELFGWVVREAVTNVVRHSGARVCTVTWSWDAGTARLEVTDDGAGPPEPVRAGDAGEAAGHGLAGLRDRVAVSGGRLVAGPAGDGFGLSVEVPVAAPREAVAR
jgi:two-component system, NarL family, sensor histidine kinase DesK